MSENAKKENPCAQRICVPIQQNEYIIHWFYSFVFICLYITAGAEYFNIKIKVIVSENIYANQL